MPTVRPWYSTRPVATKHHDNTRCIEGNNIEDRNLAHGMGKLPLCKRCVELDSAGKQRLAELSITARQTLER